MNDLDIILMPVESFDYSENICPCLTAFVMMHSHHRKLWKRLKELRPTAGKELTEHWLNHPMVGKEHRWVDSNVVRAYMDLGCMFWRLDYHHWVLLPWEGKHERS